MHTASTLNSTFLFNLLTDKFKLINQICFMFHESNVIFQQVEILPYTYFNFIVHSSSNI